MIGINTPTHPSSPLQRQLGPLASFIVAYCRACNAHVALEPHTQDGALIAEIVRLGGIPRAFAVVPGRREVLLDEPHDQGTVTWLLGELSEHPTIATNTDLLITYLPAIEKNGIPPTPSIEQTSAPWSPLLLALERLTADGEVIAVTAAGSWRILRGILANRGYFLRAVTLAALEAEYGVETNPGLREASIEILIFSPQKRSQIFSACLMPGTSAEALVSDLRAGRQGPIPEMGLLVDERSFFGWRHAALDADLAARAQQAGLTAIPLSSLGVVEPVVASSENQPRDHVEEAGDILYWPQDPQAQVTSRHEPPNNDGNICRLIFRPGTVEVGYLMRLLATPLGHQLRELINLRATAYRNQGGAWPRALRDATLYLPDLATQRTVLTAHLAAQQLLTRVAALDAKLWEEPGTSAAGLAQVLDNLPRAAHDFDRWMDGLPYPLASTLENYCAETDARARCESLLRFFECAAAFFTILALSGQRISTSAPGTPFVLPPADTRPSGEATFGGWTWRLRRAQSVIRGQAKTTEGQRMLVRAFRTDDPAFLTLMADPALLQVLVSAQAIRNAFAHGRRPLTNDQARSRLLELEVLLEQFRRTVGGAFSNVELLAPRTSQDREKYHQNTAYRLMGRHPRLTDDILTTHTLSVLRLYLRDRRSREALPLLPLIRYQPGPAHGLETCYFFDRLTPAGAIFYSHHAAVDAEIVIHDDPWLSLALSELQWRTPDH